MIDGPTLLAEALTSEVEVEQVIAEPDAPDELLERAAASGAIVHRTAAGTLARATDTVAPQAVAAIARLIEPALGQLLAHLERPPLLLTLVDVNDPGNAGTLIRAAEAAGVGGIVFVGESVDPYNPKCVRGTAGSLFRLPVVRSTGIDALLAALETNGLRSIGTVARGGTPYDRLDLTGPSAIMVGSESHGLPSSLVTRLDELTTIPMRGPLESLNVAMAGTLVCFEAARQRRTTTNRLDTAPLPGARCG